jgi:hypothetical protein
MDSKPDCETAAGGIPAAVSVDDRFDDDAHVPDGPATRAVVIIAACKAGTS